MIRKIKSPSFLETPQQELGSLLPGREEDEGLQYALDRSCTLHCIEAMAELSGVKITDIGYLEQYIGFLSEHGAHPQRNSSSEMYRVDDGWYSVAIADLLRLNRYDVVLQRLQYGAKQTDMLMSKESGRVRSDREQAMLAHLKVYGGERSVDWLDSLQDTLQKAGSTVASIRIPSSKVEGAFGQHSVLVLDTSGGMVTYFDPDSLAYDRYGTEADAQEIVRLDDSKLIYTQPAEKFLDRMTGEVMHILPSSE